MEQNDVVNDVALDTGFVAEVGNIVKSRLLENNHLVREGYIDKQVQEKLNSRIALVEKAINSVASSIKELKKIKPDVTVYSPDGAPIQQGLSKELWENKKKITEKISKMEAALSKALNEGDYTKLEELNK